MLSGEVGYFRGAMQLTHPDFLVLDAADGRNRGSRSLKMIADASQAVSGEVLQEAFERTFYPIYPASTKLQSWDIFNCVRQVLEVLDPVADPLPETLCAAHSLASEDEALRAIHLAENDADRRRARERLAFDEAVGLQWALVSRRHGELAQSGPAAPSTSDGLKHELLHRLPFELTAGQREVLEVLSGGDRGDAADEPTAARRSRLGQDHRLGVGDAADGRRRLPVRTAGADGSSCCTASSLNQRCARPAGDGWSARR